MAEVKIGMYAFYKDNKTPRRILDINKQGVKLWGMGDYVSIDTLILIKDKHILEGIIKAYMEKGLRDGKY